MEVEANPFWTDSTVWEVQGWGDALASFAEWKPNKDSRKIYDEKRHPIGDNYPFAFCAYLDIPIIQEQKPEAGIQFEEWKRAFVECLMGRIDGEFYDER